MPSSSPHLIGKVIQSIITLNPKSVLDLGSGFGKYGLLCREYIDLPADRAYGKFKRRIDSIEAFKKYKTPLYNYVYDHVYFGDAIEILKKNKFKYDLVVFIDVLECLNKKNGKALIEEILKNSEGLLMSIPKVIWNEKAEFGNPYEIFRGEWTRKELKSFGPSLIIEDYFNYLVYIGPKEKVRDLKRKMFRKQVKKILYSLPFSTQVRRFLTGFKNEK